MIKFDYVCRFHQVTQFSLSSALFLQKYIEDKFGPDERLLWVQTHIEKGFLGKFLSLTLPRLFERGHIAFMSNY